MRLELRSSTSRRLEFVVRETHPSFVNALRRTLLSDVPKLAIEDVTIYENSSALFDEILAERLGQLPIPTPPGALNFRESCTACQGEGCPLCTVSYTLNKEGPCTIYSGDLNPQDSRFRIPDPGIPIVKLLPNQRLMLEAVAVLGKGSKHAKWSPVTAVGYREIVRARATGPIPPHVAEVVRATAPEGIVRLSGSRIEILDEERAVTYLEGVAEKVGEIPGITWEREEGSFLFFLETDGAMSPQEALRSALQILMDNLRRVEEEMKELPRALPVG